MAGCRRRPARLGHLARRAVLRLRDSRRIRASTSTSGWTRRSATSPASRRCANARAWTSSRYLDARQHGRAAPLHRQGHRQLPRPVLAGGAARRRLPRADAAARQRLPDGQRREDVEVARHLHHGAHLPRRRASIRKRCATTSPTKTVRRRRRPRPQPRRLHRARELRPGRQVRQPRQPLRGLHREALRRRACRRRCRIRAMYARFVAQLAPIARSLRAQRGRGRRCA